MKWLYSRFELHEYLLQEADFLAISLQFPSLPLPNGIWGGCLLALPFHASISPHAARAGQSRLLSCKGTNRCGCVSFSGRESEQRADAKCTATVLHNARTTPAPTVRGCAATAAAAEGVQLVPFAAPGVFLYF